jgi:hypothetical protein
MKDKKMNDKDKEDFRQILREEGRAIASNFAGTRIESIIEKSVPNAMDKYLRGLGFTVDQKIEIQKDQAFIRDERLKKKDRKTIIDNKIITFTVVGLLTFIIWNLREYIKRIFF